VNYGPDDYSEWIAGQTGLDMRIRRVVHARPNQSRLEGVNIVDPEDGRLVARCESLEILTGEDGTGLHFSTITVQPDQFSRLLEILHERILRQRRLLENPVYTVASRVILPTHGQEIRLTEFRLDAHQSRNGPEAMLVFRWVDRPDGELVRLHLLRDQTIYPASTRIELLTGDTDLPCTLLYQPTPPMDQVLKTATFRGNLRISSTATGWHGDVTGYLKGIRFEALDPSPSRGVPLATGSAMLEIRRCIIEKSWMRQLDGRLDSTSGNLEVATLARIAQQLGFVGEIPIPENGQVAYDEMAIDFQMAPGSVTLRGACSGNAGAMIMANNQVMFREPQQSLTTLQVIQAMFNLGPTRVPVSAEEHPLLRAIPNNR
jgi:hypothetical protein